MSVDCVCVRNAFAYLVTRMPFARPIDRELSLDKRIWQRWFISARLRVIKAVSYLFILYTLCTTSKQLVQHTEKRKKMTHADDIIYDKTFNNNIGSDFCEFMFGYSYEIKLHCLY